ncbi:serine/threonine-protein kinase [Thermobacillus sp. ZCTH02-B1]|uniref:serine/threonine-protein kinase n=1 Tax=Thermobacillus sp. ZCTH02-B1 TaxID=1858795 RepID=UPI0025DC1C93|nr:serine/threonine-protein kinase [Thermobacillus sp. ZCTH02-B1]
MISDSYRERPGGRLPSPGEIVAGRYAIIREAGRGGMSVVYEAADLKLGGKHRAVKALKPGTRFARDAGAAELEVLQRIDHPRLPQVIDVIPPADGGPLMIVTDFVSGEPLTALFAREGRRMDPRRAAAVAAGVCEALAYLHGLRPPVVHLDVKPSNVMLDPAAGVRLIDFGIARLLGAGSGAGPRLGTPGFAAPEQAAGAPCGPAADVYAAGALLYWLLSGGHAPKPDERAFRRLEADVPDSVLDLMARMLSRDPALRPPAWQAAALLAQAAGGDAAHIAAVGRMRPRPRIVAVASFSRGAGATMLSALLAPVLARRRPTALVELTGGEPELLALLAGGDAAVAPAGRPSLPPVSRRHIAWQSGSRLQVHALHPDQGAPADGTGFAGSPEAGAGSPLDPERFAFPEDDGAEPPIVIADLSSGWIRGEGRAAAAACDMLLMVADPSVWRWTQERRAAWRELARRRESAGRPTLWIANQDARFPQRSAWIRLMPQSPAAFVPQLGPGEWPAAAWSGNPADGRPGPVAAALRSLEPVAARILDG